ncbi:hypothetical protein R6Q57_009149 [Mikania cordata]
MLLHSWSFSSRLLQSTNQSIRICYEADRLYSRRRYLKLSTIASLTVGTNVIVEIAHNKPLIAATLCAAAGQLAKPFTASILYQKDFDPKAAISAGGFPSTHSSAAVATAMSIGLERGFSDSIFGLAVVYAALTMYDAQVAESWSKFVHERLKMGLLKQGGKVAPTPCVLLIVEPTLVVMAYSNIHRRLDWVMSQKKVQITHMLLGHQW